MELTIFNYDIAATSIAKSALIEVMSVLSNYADHITLIGGWVPYLIS